MMSKTGLIALSGGIPCGPPRTIAAIVMGEGVLPPPASFDLMIMIAAMAVHLMPSIVIGVGFALIAKRSGLLIALGVGSVFGPALHVLNFYGITAM